MSRCDVYFFIDALGAEITEHLPLIRDMAPHWHRLRSVFGYSSTCVPSILSGRYPQEHNHWSFFTHSAETSLAVPWWLRVLPGVIRDRGRVRRYLSAAQRRMTSMAIFSSTVPIAELHQYGHCESRNIFKPGGMNIGTNIVDDVALWHFGMD